MLPEALVFLTVAGEVFLLVLVGVEGVDELLVEEDDMVRGRVFDVVLVVAVVHDRSLTISLLEILILVGLLPSEVVVVVVA